MRLICTKHFVDSYTHTNAHTHSAYNEWHIKWEYKTTNTLPSNQIQHAKLTHSQSVRHLHKNLARKKRCGTSNMNRMFIIFFSSFVRFWFAQHFIVRAKQAHFIVANDMKINTRAHTHTHRGKKIQIQRMRDREKKWTMNKLSRSFCFYFAIQQQTKSYKLIEIVCMCMRKSVHYSNSFY